MLAVAGALVPPEWLAVNTYVCSPAALPRTRQTLVELTQLVHWYAVGSPPPQEASSTTSVPTVGFGFAAVTTRLQLGTISGGGGGGGVVHVTCTVAGTEAPLALAAMTV